jgi:hypothetical protein
MDAAKENRVIKNMSCRNGLCLAGSDIFTGKEK